MGGKLLFTIGMSMLCCACAPANQASRTALPDPAAMTYRSAWREAGQVTLTQGVFREPAGPGSATELVVRLSDRQVFGTLDGKESGAVILVTEAGGTGTFSDLALLTRTADGWVNRDVVQLGDRVDIHELAIRDNRVVVVMTIQGPQDPMCCPTRRVERRFAVQGDRLLAAGENPVVLPAAGLVGPVWQWVQTVYNNDTQAMPPHSGNYTVQFGADGTVDVRADCNRKGGRYSGQDRQFAIEITHSTMAACPDDSLEGPFVRDLTAGASWFLKNGDLYIDLKYDTGTMRFKK